MTRITYRFFSLIIGTFLMIHTGMAQSVNFEETWKEFLDNNKISNMSALNKPSKFDDPLNYIKYLLMNTNNSFCQSEVEKAEKLMAELNQFSEKAYERIPKFVEKKDDLTAKIKALYQIDDIWQQFLDTKTVDIDELESIKAAKTLCEKQTLAKYSYMQAYHNFCQGNVSRAKAIIENRTLKLAEKTSMRVEDVQGLKPELAKMKKLFQNINELDATWQKYVKTGVSPGFDTELPLFPCNPIPNMKEWVLKGAVDVCNSGTTMLDKIKKAQTKSGVDIDGSLAKKIKELETAIEEEEGRLTVLNKAWTIFIPNNEISKEDRKYGYEYCRTEPLIKAYIMDGFANVCGNAEDRLQQIDQLRKSETLNLDKVTATKVDELIAELMQNRTDELDINDYWEQFKAEGDQLAGGYQLADYYCDHVYDVKSWVIQGLSGGCQEGREFLEQIDEIQETLEFEFAIDIRCRVTKLRIKVWDCQHQALSKLASIDASGDALEEKIAELMKEYGMEARPEVCVE